MMIMAYLEKLLIIFHLSLFSIAHCEMFVKRKSKGVESLQSVETRGLLQCATVCVEGESCGVFEYKPLSCSPGKQMQPSKTDTATQTYAWFKQETDPSPTSVYVAGCDQRTQGPVPKGVPCPKRLLKCSQKCDLNCLKSAVKQQSNVVNCTLYDIPLLLNVASCDGVDMVKFLLKEGSDICAKIKDSTVLHAAVSNLEVLRLIFKTKMINIEAKKTGGNTPLMSAAMQGEMTAVRFLYDHGADLRTVDAQGRNVLHNAGKADQRDTVRELLKMNISDILDAKDNRGNTPVVYAAVRCNKEIVKMFRESGCDMTVQYGRKSIGEELKKCA